MGATGTLERTADRLGPTRVAADVEGIAVDAFPCVEAMLDRLVAEIRKPGKALFFSLNAHGANMARRLPRFRRLLQRADTVVCDGAGIAWASRVLGGPPIPRRLSAGDYMPRLLERLAEEGLTAFFLAGRPGVAEAALARLAERVPRHTVLGCHHGYLSGDPALEERVVARINALRPDLLLVGFGMPLQEYWIEDNLHRLDVGACMPFGATLDYLSGRVPRCPAWLGERGLEWLYRLCLEPRRMAARYLLGNPWFVGRVLAGRLRRAWRR